MKKIVPLIVIAFLAASCACKKPVSPTSASLLSGCPPDGTCSIRFFDDRTISVKKDEWNIASYDTLASADSRVVVFRYEKRIPKGIQDGFYNEELVMVLSKGETPELKKAVYGRFCYCKGETGYYELEPSDIRFSVDGKKIGIDFRVREVRQVVSSISFELK